MNNSFKNFRITGLVFLIIISNLTFATNKKTEKPNILWITTEDISPRIGCYGDDYAYTPTVDKLAAEGVKFTNAFATAPVCAPARSCIVSGVFASSLGTAHLRAPMSLAKGIKLFPQYLKEAGYYTTNNSKQDYNYRAPENTWDESSKKAHWKNRKPGQPFFSVFNLVLTHQGQIRYGEEELKARNEKLPPEARHYPFYDAPLPPYYPNTRVCKNIIADIYTQITLMDMEVKRLIDEVEEAGLKENTIIFFYSDHGDGIPRHKRFMYDSGLKVPFVVWCPEKYQHLLPVKSGNEETALLSFEDLAPTMLSLVGQKVPDYMNGRIFMGPQKQKERKFIFATRDRVDEVLEVSRTVRDERFQYIRNFRSDRAMMQLSRTSEQSPVRQELRRLDAINALRYPNNIMMRPDKAVEELYDIKNDPFQLNNLANNPAYKEQLERMKKVLFNWMIESKDVCLVPEPEMRRFDGKSPYNVIRDTDTWPMEEIVRVADMCGRGKSFEKELLVAAKNPAPAIRYWASVGLGMLENVSAETSSVLKTNLTDASKIVRIASAEALCQLGEYEQGIPLLGKMLMDEEGANRLYASMSLVSLGVESYRAADYISSYDVTKLDKVVFNNYTGRNIEHLGKMLILKIKE